MEEGRWKEGRKEETEETEGTEGRKGEGRKEGKFFTKQIWGCIFWAVW
jgi:hypothetical protein